LKCLVTGGAGFIGSHLVQRLVAEGADVRVVDDLSTGKKENLGVVPGVGLAVRDLAVEPADDLVRGVDVVFHLAAIPSVPRSVQEPLRSHDSGATATLRLLIAARDAGVPRFINSSSSSVYGNAAQLPVRESMPTAPRSIYAVAKLASEGYTRAFASLYGMSTVSLRYFNVFGPRQDPDSPYAAVIPRFVAAYMEGARPRVHGDGSQSRDFTYVDNVIDANLLAARATALAGEAINIATSTPRSLLDVLREIGEIFGESLSPVFEAERPGDVRQSHADIDAARRLLGYEPRVEFSQGLRATIEWMREVATARRMTIRRP
jgi:UDP-N-acetylglucosamine/UDP-N-acetyl-alpha-D-glucosaminouronate 4-epimerase